MTRRVTIPKTIHHRLPGVIIIGAMKAGTTSLFRYLCMHPDVSGARLKEPAFFCDPSCEEKLASYLAMFADDQSIKCEASTNYTKYPLFDGVPQRMHQMLPDAKLIYIVRHPVERIISQLHDLLANESLRDLPSFNSQEFWDGRGRHSLDVSRYAMQLKQYLSAYPPEHICVIRFEDLTISPGPVMERIAAFVGIDPAYYQRPWDFRPYNSSRNKFRARLPVLYRYLKAAHRYRILPPVHRMLERRIARPQLTLETQCWIWNELVPDLAEFEALTGLHLGYRAPDAGENP